MRATLICPSALRWGWKGNPSHIVYFLLRSSLIWGFWSAENSEQECQEIFSSSLFIPFGGQILLELASHAGLFWRECGFGETFPPSRGTCVRGPKAGLCWAPSSWPVHVIWSVTRELASPCNLACQRRLDSGGRMCSYGPRSCLPSRTHKRFSLGLLWPLSVNGVWLASCLGPEWQLKHLLVVLTCISCPLLPLCPSHFIFLFSVSLFSFLLGIPVMFHRQSLTPVPPLYTSRILSPFGMTPGHSAIIFCQLKLRVRGRTPG